MTSGSPASTSSTFLHLAVESERGLFLSYNQGQLPFGAEDSEFFELRWKLHF